MIKDHYPISTHRQIGCCGSRVHAHAQHTHVQPVPHCYKFMRSTWTAHLLGPPILPPASPHPAPCTTPPAMPYCCTRNSDRIHTATMPKQLWGASHAPHTTKTPQQINSASAESKAGHLGHQVAGRGTAQACVTQRHAQVHHSCHTHIAAVGAGRTLTVGAARCGTLHRLLLAHGDNLTVSAYQHLGAQHCSCQTALGSCNKQIRRLCCCPAADKCLPFRLNTPWHAIRQAPQADVTVQTPRQVAPCARTTKQREPASSP
jgi:hypothetical protein